MYSLFYVDSIHINKACIVMVMHSTTVCYLYLLTGTLMFTVTLSLGDRRCEIEVIMALFRKDAGISEL